MSNETLEDIKDRVAKAEGFKNWLELTWEVNYTSYGLLWQKVANEMAADLLKENQELKARCQVHANMVGQLAEKLERKEALNTELLEVLEKARRAIQQAATESYREEIQRYLSGGYAEMIQAACIKDSLGIESAINKAKAQ